ncbi:hypothetical protein PM082_011030 [Marasmius tenuissimus]|nr:hypothetical protein PM082_011030 [Marasmius tenuissimus]
MVKGGEPEGVQKKFHELNAHQSRACFKATSNETISFRGDATDSTYRRQMDTTKRLIDLASDKRCIFVLYHLMSLHGSASHTLGLCSIRERNRETCYDYEYIELRLGTAAKVYLTLRSHKEQNK